MESCDQEDFLETGQAPWIDNWFYIYHSHP